MARRFDGTLPPPIDFSKIVDTFGGFDADPSPLPPPPSSADEDDFSARLERVRQRMAAEGHPLKIISAKRTAEQQNEQYRLGRTPADGYAIQSQHQKSTAADLAFVGKANWKLLGQIAREEGLIWGGDFTKPDRGHVQLKPAAAVTARAAVPPPPIPPPPKPPPPPVVAARPPLPPPRPPVVAAQAPPPPPPIAPQPTLGGIGTEIGLRPPPAPPVMAAQAPAPMPVPSAPPAVPMPPPVRSEPLPPLAASSAPTPVEPPPMPPPPPPPPPARTAATAPSVPIEGLVEQGNVDLRRQPRVKPYSTVDTHSYGIRDENGREMQILLPSVTPDGRHLRTDYQIFAEYKKTGRHLGIFTDKSAADRYTQKLHQDYAAGKYGPPESGMLPSGLRAPEEPRQVQAAVTPPPPPPTPQAPPTPALPDATEIVARRQRDQPDVIRPGVASQARVAPPPTPQAPPPAPAEPIYVPEAPRQDWPETRPATKPPPISFERVRRVLPQDVRLKPERPFKEQEFWKWYTDWAKKTGINPDPDDPLHFYDYRKAYRAGDEPTISPQDFKYHWPSKWKKPGHPQQYVYETDPETGKPVRIDTITGKKAPRPTIYDFIRELSEQKKIDTKIAIAYAIAERIPGIKEFVASLASGTMGMISGVVGAGGMAGLVSPEDVARVGQIAEDLTPDIMMRKIAEDPGGTLGDPMWWLSAFGQTIPSMVSLGSTGVITRGLTTLKYAPEVAAALGEALTEGGSTYTAAIQAGATHKVAATAAAWVAAFNVPMLGLTNLPIFERLTKRQILNVIIAAAMEGGQETFQQGLSNLAAKYKFDPTQPLTAGMAESFVLGGMVGGVAHAIAGGPHLVPPAAEGVQQGQFTPLWAGTHMRFTGPQPDLAGSLPMRPAWAPTPELPLQPRPIYGPFDTPPPPGQPAAGARIQPPGGPPTPVYGGIPTPPSRIIPVSPPTPPGEPPPEGGAPPPPAGVPPGTPPMGTPPGAAPGGDAAAPTPIVTPPTPAPGLPTTTVTPPTPAAPTPAAPVVFNAQTAVADLPPLADANSHPLSSALTATVRGLGGIIPSIQFRPEQQQALKEAGVEEQSVPLPNGRTFDGFSEEQVQSLRDAYRSRFAPPAAPAGPTAETPAAPTPATPTPAQPTPAAPTPTTEGAAPTPATPTPAVPTPAEKPVSEMTDEELAARAAARVAARRAAAEAAQQQTQGLTPDQQAAERLRLIAEQEAADRARQQQEQQAAQPTPAVPAPATTAAAPEAGQVTPETAGGAVPETPAPTPAAAAEPAAPAGPAAPAVDRGLLYDQEVRQNSRNVRDRQGTRSWVQARSTPTTMAHAEQLITDGLQDGDVVEDSRGDRWIVRRDQTRAGERVALAPAENPNIVGGMLAWSDPDGKWHGMDSIRPFMERARIVERGGQPVAVPTARPGVPLPERREPFNAENLMRVFRVSREQAEAAMAIAQSMGLNLDQIYITSEGTPGPNTLWQRARRVFSDAFRRWFGNSVVTRGGVPRVVYTGSMNPDITGFKGESFAGWFTADSTLAQIYAGAGGATRWGGMLFPIVPTPGGVMYPVYLSMQHPLDLTGIDMNLTLDMQHENALSDALEEAMGVTVDPDTLSDIERAALARVKYAGYPQVWMVIHSPEFAAWVRSNGFDGLIAREGRTKVWAPLDAWQIKSATGNQGAYDPSNPNILYQDAENARAMRAWYFSNVDEALNTWQTKGTADQLLAHLKKVSGAMDEAEALGLVERVRGAPIVRPESAPKPKKGAATREPDTFVAGEWLRDHPTLTREELRDYINSHRIDVVDALHTGGTTEEFKEQAADYISDIESYDYTVEFDEEGNDEPSLIGPDGGAVYEDDLSDPDLHDPGMVRAWRDLINEWNDTPRTQYGYGRQVLPNGENYRELLLILKRETPPFVALTALPEGYEVRNAHAYPGKPSVDSWEVWLPSDERLHLVSLDLLREHGDVRQVGDGWVLRGGYPNREFVVGQALSLLNHRIREQRNLDPRQFQGSHWTQKDVLLHVRMNDREVRLDRPLTGKLPAGYSVQQTGPRLRPEPGTEPLTWQWTKVVEGMDRTKRAHVSIQMYATEEEAITGAEQDANTQAVLFLEEIQSDWHQAGRKYAYQGEVDELKARQAALMQERTELHGVTRGGTFTEAQNSRWTVINKDLKQLDKQLRNVVPEGPFKGNSWKRLALKRMIAYGAEHGYDGIAWTTGATQNDRNALSQVVDTLIWEQTGSDEGSLKGVKNGATAIQRTIDPDELDKWIPEEIAERLLNAPVNELGQRVIAGEQIEVGGEGMRGFYDQEIPNLLNALIKKYGQRAGWAETPTGTTYISTYTGPEPTYEEVQIQRRAPSLGEFQVGALKAVERVMRNLGPRVTFKDIIEEHLTPDVARVAASLMHGRFETVAREDMTPVHYVETPRAMREQVRDNAVALFQDRKAAIEFTESGEILIRAMQSPDISSAMHELAHAARRMLFDLTIKAEHREGISDADIVTASEWAGARLVNGQWTWSREAEEKFARGFERYLRDGSAPTSTLASIFQAFARWLGEIYQTLAGSSIDIQISPEMRRVYDNLVSRVERVTAEREAAAAGAAQAQPSQPFTAANLKTTFGLDQEEAEAAVSIADAMGLPTRRIRLTVGGTPGAGALFQKPENARALRGWYFSNIEDALRTWQQDKGTIDQLLGHLKKFKGAYDEAEAIGLMGWLAGIAGPEVDQRQMVTRQQVQDHLDDYRIDVEESVRGEGTAFTDIPGTRENIDALNSRGYSIEDTDPGQSLVLVRQSDGERFYDQSEARDELRGVSTNALTAWTMLVTAQQIRQEPRWPEHRLGGEGAGTNYRELLLMVRSKPMPASARPEPLTEIPPEYEVAQVRSSYYEEGPLRWALVNADLSARESARIAGGANRQVVLESRRPDAGSYRDTEAEARVGGLFALNEQRREEAEQKWREEHPDYASGHWSEKNVIVHIRVTERTASDGRIILFIEEIQSDWHQTGRKYGYKKDEAKIRARISEARDERDAIRHRRVAPGATPERFSVAPLTAAEKRQIRKLDREIRKHERNLQRLLPESPFKGPVWKKLALKRMLVYAAEHGYAGMGWTTGAQQNKINQLSSHVDKLKFTASNIEEPDEGGHLYGYLNGYQSVDKYMDDEEELESYIGKELTERLIGLDAVPDANDQFAIEGLDLEAGGSGMIGFYDKELVNFMNDIVKKYQQRVGRTTLNFEDDTRRQYVGPEHTSEHIFNLIANITEGESGELNQPNGAWISESKRDRLFALAEAMRTNGTSLKTEIDNLNANDRYAASGVARTLGGVMGPSARVEPIHFIEMPQTMREDLRDKGVALFQDQKAAVEFTESGEIVMRAMQSPDVSSALHELAHIARRMLFDLGIPAKHREGISDADIVTASQWAGARLTNGQWVWSREAEEKFARGFERYLHDGKAPTSTLKSIFQSFARWLGQIYRNLAGSGIDVQISPEMRAVYDNLVTRAERVSAARSARAEAAAAAARAKAAEPQAEEKPAAEPSQWKKVGENTADQAIYEDQYGARSYMTDEGIRRTEPAGTKTHGAEFQTEIEKQRADLAAERAKIFAEIAAEARKPSAGIDPKLLTLMVKLVRNYIKAGMVEFKAVVQQFQLDATEFGLGNPRDFDDHLEEVWEMLHEERPPAISTILGPAAQPETTIEGEGPDGTTRGPVAGSEEGESGTERPGGGRTAEPGDTAGAGPGAGGTEAGPGEGTDAGGAVPAGEPVPGPEPEQTTSLTPNTYRITDDDQVGTGTTAERVTRNFAAIQVIRTMETEGRTLATPEEQKVLVKYVGWGGLSRIFEPWKDAPPGEDNTESGHVWGTRRATLQRLLTSEEYAAARNSTQNAHYTSPTVIRAMWNAVQRLGVTHGSALEPSAGIGHFVGMAPDALRAGDQPGLNFALVDKDTMSAKIAKALYPGSYVQGVPFETAKLPTNHFVVAISNVPFGDIPIVDRFFQGHPRLKQRIHNYFFGKSLDYVAPGGLVAFVTSHGTLDAVDEVGMATRQYLASQADFLGAIRLPYTAFKANARTEVVTDIIFLRKRREGETPSHAGPWMDSTSLRLPNARGEKFDQSVNVYFHDHPEMVLGTQDSTGTMRAANQYNVTPTGDLDKQLAEAIEKLPANVIDITPPEKSMESFIRAQPPLGTRPFEYLIHTDGTLAQVSGDGKTIEPVAGMSKADEARVRSMLPMRAALHALYNLQNNPDLTDEQWKAAQKVLETAYDKFVDKDKDGHGFISLPLNYEAFHEDPDLALILSLEDWDPELEVAHKSAIFTQESQPAAKAAREAETSQDALHISLAETGRIHFGRIADLLHTTPEEAQTRLEGEGLVIYTPSGWELPAQYLSGNVRVKLMEAEAAVQLDTQYQTAVDRLKAVIPEDLPPHKIISRLGANWIPIEVVTEFVKHITGSTDLANWKIRYTEHDAQWHIDGAPSLYTSRFSMDEIDTKYMLLAALNDKRIVIKTPKDPITGRRTVDKKATERARQKRTELYNAFTEWLYNLDPARRDWAVRTYNDRFNATVDRKVDGSYLTFPGMTQWWRDHIEPHQRNAVARILQFGNTLLAHVVGAGKTLTMVSAGMEMRRMGIARKPMYVVPNHLVSNLAGEMLSYYPSAKVLIISGDDLGSDAEDLKPKPGAPPPTPAEIQAREAKKSMTAARRKRLTARIASGNWDAVIMPASAFVRVSMSVEAEADYHKTLLAEVEQAILDEWQRLVAEGVRPGGRRSPPSIKRLENTRDKIRGRLDKLADRPKDNSLTFEQLGVDALFVDESHLFKNLYFHTTQKAAGIPSASDAQRAMDMYLKTRYINQLSNYRNVVFASGTPISNSMAEVFINQKFLQERDLIRANINHFDAWLAQFASITIETELDPSGTGLGARARLKKFVNLPDLAQMFRQVADVQMIDDLPDLKARRPKLRGDDFEYVIVPASEAQLAYLQDLKRRSDVLSPRTRHLDNMAKITVDGRMSSLDMRMIDRRLPDHAGSKVHVVTQAVHEIWEDTAKVKGTQLIFLDSGVPGTEQRATQPKTYTDQATGEKRKRPATEEERHRGIDLYREMKNELIAKGIPAAQIVFMHDLDGVPPNQREGARKALIRKVKRGEVRVLIGSSDKMATGLNVQDLIVALHHVDPTYRPAEIEQRNGRGLRQGNLLFKADKNFRLRIRYYITQGADVNFGFDAYMWQLIEAKAKIIADFFKGKITQRTVELDLDQAVLTSGGLKAVATGNVAIMELAVVEAEADRLNVLREGYEDAKRAAGWKVPALKEALATYEKESARSVATGNEIRTFDPGAEFKATVGGVEITGSRNVGEAIFAEAKKIVSPPSAGHPGEWAYNAKPTLIGTFRGLNLWIEGNGTRNPHVVLRHPNDEPPKYSYQKQQSTDYLSIAFDMMKSSAEAGSVAGLAWKDPLSLVNRLNEAATNTKKEGAGKFYNEKIEQTRNELADQERALTEEFPQEAEARRINRKLRELRISLGMAPDEPGQTMTPGDEGDGSDEDTEDEGGTGDLVVYQQPPGRTKAEYLAARDARDRAADRARRAGSRRGGGPPEGGEGGGGAAAEGESGVEEQKVRGSLAEMERRAERHGPGQPMPRTFNTADEVRTAVNPQAPEAQPISGIEFPELIELAKALLGSVPGIMRAFRNAAKLAEFRYGGDVGKIGLSAALFKGNLQDLTAALAHEMGHALDWLPHKTLRRGNLLGRLLSLREFTNSTFTGPDGKTIKEEVIRKQLRDLSDYWRPWDSSTASAHFKAYRHSSRELYADAISVLLNNPRLLEERAPAFFAAFFKHLDEKPDAKKAYFEIQDLLSGTHESLINRRVLRDFDMLKMGDAKAIDIYRLLERERAAARQHYWMWFRTEMVDKNSFLVKLVKKAKKLGRPVNPDTDPRYFLEAWNYLGGKLKAFTQEHVQPMYEALIKGEVGWHTFGLALMYDRVAAGDRSDMANPGAATGILPTGDEAQNARRMSDAAERRLELVKGLDPTQRAILEKQIEEFRSMVRRVVNQMYQAGLVSDALYEKMRKNPAYATFYVVEHLDKEISWKIYNQKGTLKDIINPADATIAKMLGSIRAIERQKMITSVFDFLHEYEPTLIKQAPERWDGRKMAPVKPDSKPVKGMDWDMVYYYEKGRLRAKYVPKYIADGINNQSLGSTNMIVSAFRWMNSHFFRPVFTTGNLGFQTANVSRDFFRFWKNIPTMSLGRAIARYWEGRHLAGVRAFGLASEETGAIRQAYREMRGKPGTAPTTEELQAYKDLIEAEKAGILSITYRDFSAGRQVQDSLIEDIMARTGVGEFRKERSKNELVRQGKAAIGWITAMGDFIETLPKSAAIYEYRGKGSIADISPDQRSYIRRKVGTPDILAGGTWKPWSNEFFLFSNAIVQGVVADAEVGMGMESKNKFEFWWKTAAFNIAPKMALFAAVQLARAAAGYDDDDTELDDAFAEWIKSSRKISEYDISNYFSVPLWVDPKGNLVYIRIPQDDTGRLIGGMAWKLMRMARGDNGVNTFRAAMQVLDYMGGQVPNTSPLIQAASDLAQYGSGTRVYDPFRNQFLFTEDEAASTDESHKLNKFIGYEFQQLGGGIVWKFYPGDERPRQQTGGQAILDLPITSNIVGRWMKISQYGTIEKLREAAIPERGRQADVRLNEKDAVINAINSFMDLDKNAQTGRKQQEMALEVATKLYPPDQRAEQYRDILKKIRMGVARGQSDDPLIDAVMSARANGEKVAMIVARSKEQSPAEMQKWLLQAVQYGVISPEVRSAAARAMGGGGAAAPRPRSADEDYLTNPAPPPTP